MTACKYCRREKWGAMLECYQCCESVHAMCLKSLSPGALVGDVFFNFQCCTCSGTGEETLDRYKMSWVDVCLLALYNLKEKFSTISNDGYYHRELHIKKFIHSNWAVLFPHKKTKRKSWCQMVFTTLKSSPQYFHCGDKVLKHGLQGWYRLAKSDTLPNQALLDKKNRKRKGPELVLGSLNDDDDSTSISADSSSNHETNICLSSLNTLYSDTSRNCDNMYSRSYVKPTPILSDYLLAGDDLEEDIDIEVCKDSVDIRATPTEKDIPFKIVTNVTVSEPSCSFQVGVREIGVDVEEESETVEEDEEAEDFNKESNNVLAESLFVRNPNSGSLPWIVPAVTDIQENCRPMNENEEFHLQTSIRERISNGEKVSVSDIRLHRKLAVRRLRRERNVPVFDLDQLARSGGTAGGTADCVQPIRILDRFQHRELAQSVPEEMVSFRTKLLGHKEQFTSFTSPYTQRILKPFIRRDRECKPLWLQLMDELLVKVNSKVTSWSLPCRAPLDYSYVRPHHIPAVNSLAQQYFWPGINLAESLQYPDFSCIAQYKKLIVGFAFLVPDVGYNEAYISFIFTRPEWRRAGIATFMLYHLIQTCMGRDITLHVSAKNPAVMLYQKFGFKVEEFVQDFYDKYVPINSNESKHALFLRLSR